MPRIARVVVPDYPHHVTQCGNRRQQTFFCDGDYQAYRMLMAEWCSKCGVEAWAYCLMSNPVHLIAVPSTEAGLRSAIGEAHRRYTRGPTSVRKALAQRILELGAAAHEGLAVPSIQGRHIAFSLARSKKEPGATTSRVHLQDLPKELSTGVEHLWVCAGPRCIAHRASRHGVENRSYQEIFDRLGGNGVCADRGVPIAAQRHLAALVPPEDRE